MVAAALAEQVDPPGASLWRSVDRQVTALRVSVALLLLVTMAAPVVATATGLRDDVMANGDEVVAALLPVEFARGAPAVLFPGNSYQGVLEVPVYALSWLVAGPELLPLRLFHQLVWLAAIVVWFAAALEPARQSGRVGVREWWWAAFTVAGLLGVTSAVGWPVWFRIYPGYQAGALLGGAGVLVAVRAVGAGSSAVGRWFVAGLLAGAAVYAQPMHAPAMVVVGCLAVCSGRSGVARRAGAAVVGVVLGLAPLVLWNLRNDLATLDPDTQPVVEHPEWGYPQRVLGVARTTSRVLWGGDQLSIGRPAQWGAVLCAVALVVLSVLGVVTMVRWRGASRAVLLAPVLMLLGLPVLRVMSLQADPRYAVGWWPGLVVLVAAGAAAAAERSGGGGRAARTALAGVVLVHLGVVGVGAAGALADQRDRIDGLDATVDLVDDLRRCGVDTVWGDYWAVYPTLWASDVDLGAVVTWGPERLTTFRPDDLASVGRVAVLVPAVMADTSASAELATDGTGRGATGWTPVTDPDTGVRIGLERTAAALPEGCLGAGGLVPVAGG